MRLSSPTRGFTLTELLVATVATTLLFAAIFTASAALNRSYAAVDDYFSSHMQQIRIIDYLARDVNRSFSVTTSADLKTVTCIMPKYIVDSGDTEAVANSSNIGTRRMPVLAESTNFNKSVVDYRTPDRILTDGVTVLLSPVLASLTASFTAADVGRPIAGTNIQNGATILNVVDSTKVTLSKSALKSGTGVRFSILSDGVRTVLKGVTSAGSTSLTLPSTQGTYAFAAADVGKPIVGATIAAGATISAYTSSTAVTMSLPAKANGVNQAVTIGGAVVIYTVNGNTITRSQDGVITTIASSTDQLVPLTTNYVLANTQYASSTVTFQPIFTMNGTTSQRSGTTIFSTAHLRNRRRGN